MASSKVLKVVSAFVLLAFVASDTAIAQQVIPCTTVQQYLIPCIPYVLNGGSVPPSTCCSGIQSLYHAAKTTSDKQAACQCLKNAIKSFSPTGNVTARAAGLPAECNINLPYNISPSIDCKSVK